MQTQSFAGRVASVGVKGFGPNSAQLLFSIAPPTGAPKSFVALAPSTALAHEPAAPGHEPQVFAAMAALLTAMCGQNREVRVEYVTPEGGGTDIVASVEVPA